MRETQIERPPGIVSPARWLAAASRHPSVVVAVALLMTASSFLLLSAPIASPSALANGAHVLTLRSPSAAHPASERVTDAKFSSALPPARASMIHPAPPATGRGTFFQNQQIPLPTLGNETCARAYFFFSYCVNDTNSPSVVTTPKGVIAVAYTAFTNASPCSPARGNATTEVGFVVSTNGGSTWSAPRYLGNPDCSFPTEFNFTSAWMPSVTALANGTLALAYIEYNFSTAFGGFPPDTSPPEYPHDRLVVSLSYNDGSTWTNPDVINSTSNTLLNSSSWMPTRPWIDAYGKTLYLAWENSTSPQFYYGATSFGVHLVNSTDGGATWSSPVALPTMDGSNAPPFSLPTPTNASMNPSLAVGPTGELFVAYTTNVSYPSGTVCSPYACTVSPDYYLYPGTADVVVARSTNNGTTFSLSTVQASVPTEYNSQVGGWVEPAPQIAFGGPYGQLFVTYAAGLLGNYCFSSPCNSFSQFLGLESTIWVSNSSNDGASFSSAHPVSLLLQDPINGSNLNINSNPSLAVNATTGELYLESTYLNATACLTDSYGFVTCGEWYQIYYTSSDNGTSFTSPVYVSGNSTPNSFQYSGLYTTMTLLNGTPIIAWTQELCPAWSVSYCFWPFNTLNGTDQVVVSRLFTGAGLTVTFNESEITDPALNWTVQISGNYRTGPVGSNLTVGGVPAGQVEEWSATWVNKSYGDFFAPVNRTPTGPGAFAAPTTIHVNYSEFYQIIIAQNPPVFIGPCYGFGFCANYYTTLFPGTYLIPAGKPFSLNLTYQTLPSLCYYCWNLTFQAWVGTGPGALTTNAQNVTYPPTGPANETATFALNSFCQFPPVGCKGLNYTYLFEETGLPAGTNWTVTLGNQTKSSTGIGIVFNESGTQLNYTIWTVPNGPSQYWVGTGNFASPIFAPGESTVHVTFTSTLPATRTFNLEVNASGLPAGTTFGFTLDGQPFGVPASGETIPIAGGPATFSASTVFTSNDVAYYASSASVTPLVQGKTPFASGLPGSWTANGSARITINYLPMYRLTVTASTGGTSTPASEWVHSGVGVGLTATANVGYVFTGWSGSGPGSVTTSASNPIVTPTGPVTELATFQAVIPTWNVTVTAVGLPTGQAATLQLGGLSYSGGSPFNITNLTSGVYTVGAPVLYSNSSLGTRYVPVSIGSSFTFVGNTTDITSDGTFTVTYVTQYTLTVGSSAFGTTTPAAGSYWVDASMMATLTAMPSSGYEFDVWNGTGTGSSSAGTAITQVTMNSAITEVPVFLPIPPKVPATFVLQLSESGLPPGATWAASIGSFGLAGTQMLVFPGLNGSYLLNVPDITVSAGVRYVAPDGGAIPLTVTSNQSFTVIYTKQFEVTVGSSAGGTATPSTEWVAPGTMVALAARANPGYTFVNWTGSGTGAYSGNAADQNVTVSSPVTELASFEPTPPRPQAQVAFTSGSPYALALLIGLLLVGLLIGLLVFRRRGGGPSGAEMAPAGGRDEEGLRPYVPPSGPTEEAEEGEVWGSQPGQAPPTRSDWEEEPPPGERG